MLIRAASILLLALPVLVSACTGGGGASGGTTVVATDSPTYKYEQANLSVKVNQPATITLQNKGTQVHDWVVQGLSQPVKVEAQAGQTRSVTFTPTQAGTFKIVCEQPGHEALGMVGQLTVTS